MGLARVKEEIPPPIEEDSPSIAENFFEWLLGMLAILFYLSIPLAFLGAIILHPISMILILSDFVFEFRTNNRILTAFVTQNDDYLSISWVVGVLALVANFLLSGSPSKTVYHIPTAPPPVYPSATQRLGLSHFCLNGQDECQQEIIHRTVKVVTPSGAGTGFILRSDKEWMLILTAGHVASDSKYFHIPSKGVVIEDHFLDYSYNATKTCSFFDTDLDAAVILAPNKRNVIYQQPEESNAQTGSRVYIAEATSYIPQSWPTRINGFEPRRQEVVVNKRLFPGASGSPIISRTGRLVGVFFAGSLIGDLGVGFYGLKPILNYRWPTFKLLAQPDFNREFKRQYGFSNPFEMSCY